MPERGEVASPGSQAGVQALHLLRRVLHPPWSHFVSLLSSENRGQRADFSVAPVLKLP